jgi:hypothetical protein
VSYIHRFISSQFPSMYLSTYRSPSHNTLIALNLSSAFRYTTELDILILSVCLNFLHLPMYMTLASGETHPRLYPLATSRPEKPSRHRAAIAFVHAALTTKPISLLAPRRPNRDADCAIGTGLNNDITSQDDLCCQSGNGNWWLFFALSCTMALWFMSCVGLPAVCPCYCGGLFIVHKPTYPFDFRG